MKDISTVLDILVAGLSLVSFLGFGSVTAILPIMAGYLIFNNKHLNFNNLPSA